MTSATPIATDRPNNVLDFLLEFYGCAAEEDIVRALPESDDTTLEQLLQAYQAFASSSWQSMDLVPPGELRPFIETSSVDDAPEWARGAFAFGLHQLESEESSWQLVDHIKHRLLYCHSVALDDPLWELASLAAAQDRLHKSGVTQGRSGSQALRNYANLLLHLKDLLRKQIVCPIVTPNLLADGHRSRQWRPEVVAALASVLDNDAHRARIDFGELKRAAPARARDHIDAELNAGATGEQLLRDTYAGIAQQRLATSISSAIESQGRTTLYLPFRYDVASLSICFDKVRLLSQHAAALSTSEDLVMSPLLELELPGLASLDPADIVSIRSNAGEFERFRHDLREAMVAADSLPPESLNRSVKMQEIVGGRMRESLRRLNEALPKSPVLSAARIGTTAFVSGMIAASVPVMMGAAAGPIGLAVVLSQLAAAGYVAAASLREVSSANQQTTVAARNHYVGMLK